MGKFKTPIHINEDAIAECRARLSVDIIYDEYATINGQRVEAFDLIEDAEQEDKNNIILMLLVDKDDSYYHTLEVLKKRFGEMFSDAEIETHLIDEAEELALERHLEETYEYEN
jgi:hypothetical protein